eukprot:COSAG02_NODE_14111_length_1308_cov_2.163772_1_plen_413_part_10
MSRSAVYVPSTASQVFPSSSQPADGDTVCPDNIEHCVFTAGSGSQGSCALTSQASCTAALDVDTDGARCRELKCTYDDWYFEYYKRACLDEPTFGNCGQASASSENGVTTRAEFAFSSEPDTTWENDNAPGAYPNAWLTYNLGEERPIVRYSLATTDIDCPRDFTFEGGDSDSGPWTVLDTQTNQACDEVAERSCTAKDSIACSAPANGATECPDNTEHCVFTPDPDGGTQGSCALTNQAECVAALAADTDGTECARLKCAYASPRMYEVPTRLCTAKDSGTYTCGQPADGATVCPDNPDHCVFVPDSSTPIAATNGAGSSDASAPANSNGLGESTLTITVDAGFADGDRVQIIDLGVTASCGIEGSYTIASIAGSTAVTFVETFATNVVEITDCALVRTGTQGTCELTSQAD